MTETDTSSGGSSSGGGSKSKTKAKANTQAAGDTFEDTDPDNDNLKVVGTELPDGAKVGVQVEANPAEDPAAQAALDAADEYRSTRSACPQCGVADGVREGATNCDSCGARVADPEG